MTDSRAVFPLGKCRRFRGAVASRCAADVSRLYLQDPNACAATVQTCVCTCVGCTLTEKALRSDACVHARVCVCGVRNMTQHGVLRRGCSAAVAVLDAQLSCRGQARAMQPLQAQQLWQHRSTRLQCRHLGTLF